MNTSLKKGICLLSALFFIGGALFAFRLGACGLLDPDEPFYSLTAKEMLQRHDPMTPVLFGKPQFEKPILFYWVEYASFKLFGVNEAAARLGPCLAGFLIVFLTYFWGRLLFRRGQIAFLSAVFLATSGVFAVMSRLVLTDMFLCLFVTAALFSFSAGYIFPQRRKIAWNLLFVFCALGFLTKGPLGVLLPFFGITAYLWANGEGKLLREFPWFSGIFLFAVIGLPWYGMMTVKYGAEFLSHFFVHENVRRFFVAEHPGNDKLLFYPAVIWLGFFPWSAFLPFAVADAFKKSSMRKYADKNPFLFLSVSFLLPVIFFVAAKSKLISYIFPVFPVLSLMLGAWIYDLYRALRMGFKPKPALRILYLFFWGVVPPASAVGLAMFIRSCDLDLSGPLFFIVFSFIPLLWGAVFCAEKRFYKISFSLVVAAVLTAMMLVFSWLLPELDPIFSSKDSTAFYEAGTKSSNKNLILTGKLFVRGVAYYSGNKNLGVYAEDPKNLFYTRHPVPIFSTLDDILKIDAGFFPVYCFLRQKELEALKKVVGSRFSVSVLRAAGPRVLARLDIPK